jgi:hypothetical protein
VLADEIPDRRDPQLPELFSGISELPEHISPASRAVLLLHHVQDLSIDEAAAYSTSMY